MRVRRSRLVRRLDRVRRGERRRRRAALALAVGAGRVFVSGAAAHAGTPACVRRAALAGRSPSAWQIA